jgi:hypothetical protein
VSAGVPLVVSISARESIQARSLRDGARRSGRARRQALDREALSISDGRGFIMSSVVDGLVSGLVWSAILGTILIAMARLVERVLADPGHYGIADVADQAGSGEGDPGPAAPDPYLFRDDIHPIETCRRLPGARIDREASMKG